VTFPAKLSLFLSGILLLFTSAHAASDDWLLASVKKPVSLDVTENGCVLALTNGIVSVTFQTRPNLAVISIRHLRTGEEFVRGVKPEAEITLNGESITVGGLLGQPDYAFLDKAWLKTFRSDSAAFQCTTYSTSLPSERLQWRRKRYSADATWPPHGLHLTFTFQAPVQIQRRVPGLNVQVHYEMYEGIPVFAKWVTVQNAGERTVTIDSLTTTILAVAERISDVGGFRTTKPRIPPSEPDQNDWAQIANTRLYVESDYSFCRGSTFSPDQAVFWMPDSQYQTQVHYDRTWPHVLTTRYPFGPDVQLAPGQTFESFRANVLVQDSDDRERRGLAIRRMYRVLAPWVTENPILMHLRVSDSQAIRNAVDQCAATGFEMIVLSFGSGLDMESTDPAYLARVKAEFDYAHSKGIEIGGYSLIASRSVGPETDVIDPTTGKPGAYFGKSPCLVSPWGNGYFRKLRNFIESTGTDVLEHDGSYPGDVCASTTHGGHRGLMDSQRAQFEKIRDFYTWCRGVGVYLNVPDWYFLNGSNKTPMGYRETNWSLPRELQFIHARQNIYDGTFEKTPSMGWMFVPLVEYHGGGAAATLEPLREHLDAYEQHLAPNFTAGVQACYRGPRLYDCDETRSVVKKWVDFYKKYRRILDSDIIHVRRPDGRDFDCILHVNPELKEKGLAVIWNPLKEEVDRTLVLPLYYTGLTQAARIREQEGRSSTVTMDREYNASVRVHLKPGAMTWFVIE
jgi:hypothetical protein